MTGSSGPGDLYDLLGVPRDAPAADITRAYHRRARALHPDARPGEGGEPAQFRELEEAYRVLHDPARRAAYDQVLGRPAPVSHQPGPGSRQPGPGSRQPGPGSRQPGPGSRQRAATSRPVAAGWPGPPDWPAGRPPGAMLWAGPVQVIPPAASSSGMDASPSGMEAGSPRTDASPSGMDADGARRTLWPADPGGTPMWAWWPW